MELLNSRPRGGLRMQAVPPRRYMAAAPAQAIAPDIDWVNCLIPSDFQEEGSCVARSTCGAIEGLIRLAQGPAAIPAGMQLDAVFVYWRSRAKFYNDQKDEGLQMTEAAQVCIELGILPPGTKIHRVPATLEAIAAALQHGPLLQAHAVGINWDERRLGSGGEIRNIPLSGQSIRGYHQTLMVGYRYRDGEHYLPLQNSWGSWGWHGLGVMSWRTWWEGFRTVHDGPYLIEPGPGWKTWTGWQPYLVRP